MLHVPGSVACRAGFPGVVVVSVHADPERVEGAPSPARPHDVGAHDVGAHDSAAPDVRAGTGVRSGGATRMGPPAAALRLQRAVGNRAFARVLAGRAPDAAVQRCGPVPCDCDDDHRAAAEAALPQAAAVQRHALPHTPAGRPDDPAVRRGTPDVRPAGPAVPAILQREPTVQREPTAKQQVAAAITENTPAAVAALDRASLREGATLDQKLAMIDILNNGGTSFQRIQLAPLWDAIPDINSVGAAQSARWKRSFEVAPETMRGCHAVEGLRKILEFDIRAVASKYLDENDAFARSELARYGLGADGKPVTGPPTAEQQKALADTRGSALALAKDQEGLRNLRSVPVGYRDTLQEPGDVRPRSGFDGQDRPRWEPMTFDPDRPPAQGPRPGDGAKPWTEVKTSHDDMRKLIRARLSTNPALYALTRGRYEDPQAALGVSGGSTPDALTQIGAGFNEVLAGIAKARPLLPALAPDLEPIIRQLAAGTVTAPGAGDRVWSQPYYQAVLDDVVAERRPGPWWQTLGLLVAEMGIWVVAGIATGGTAVALAMVAKSAAELALAEGKAQAVTAAGRSNLGDDTALVSEGQVDDAQAAVIETAVFALVDLAFAGLAVKGAISAITHHVEEAAKAAQAAGRTADRMIAETTVSKAEAETLLGEARTGAATATREAEAAETAAKGADASQTARAQAEAQKARVSADEAALAERRASALAAEAGEAKGLHAPPVAVGDHLVKVAGGRLVRCSEPCAELLVSVLDRAAKVRAGVEAATAGRAPAAREMATRLTSVTGRASALSAEAERRLAGVAATDPARKTIETDLIARAVVLERDVQAVEQKALLEAAVSGTGALDAAWAAAVRANVDGRIVARREAAMLRTAAGGAAGVVPADLDKALKNFAAQATKLERAAASGTKPRDDLQKLFESLDNDLYNLEREEFARSRMRDEGITSLAESDKTMLDELGAPKGKRGDLGMSNKAPDLGGTRGGTVVLAESKRSGNVYDALDQFANALKSPKAKAAGAIELKIYVDPESLATLCANGSVREAGGRYHLVGDLAKVDFRPVEIVPL